MGTEEGNYQGDFSYSRLPAGLGGYGEFERQFRQFEEREEKIQNEDSLGGGPQVTLVIVKISKVTDWNML